STFNEPRDVVGALNAYRILLADLAVVTMVDDDAPHERLAAAIREVKPGLTVIGTKLCPRPLEPVEGKRVAYFTTARADVHERLADGLRGDHGADVVLVCGSLSDRVALARELDRGDADVFLTELKAAGIDVDGAPARARRRDVGGGGGGGGRPAPAPAAAPRRPRPADHPARRRGDRHGQVDGRDRDRLPPRHHAGHLHRLRPPDDASLLL